MVDFAEMETQFPIKHKFFKAIGFRFILTKTRLPAEKHEDESSAWQQRVKLPRFQSSANEVENLSKVCQTVSQLEKKVL